METTRQQKIAKQIQKDVAEIFQKEGAPIVRGSLVTVTAVRISPDFSYAKIYVSIFPFEQSGEVMKRLWDYIKAHNLQDPKDKRTILADAKLKPVFGGEDSVGMFKLAGIVGGHLG